jgi:hypothetical protein
VDAELAVLVAERAVVATLGKKVSADLLRAARRLPAR